MSERNINVADLEEQSTVRSHGYGGDGVFNKGERIAYRDIQKVVKEQNIDFIDLKFVDLPGIWHHYTLPAKELSEGLFIEGTGFDGSSIRGFQTIHESDMLLKPDMSTAFIDPFCDDPTLSFICNVKDPITLRLYSRDPRYVAMKAEMYLNTTGIADTVFVGPEAEFFAFDEVYYNQTYNEGFYHVDSDEGYWNAGKKGRDGKRNLGYKPRHKEGYFPVPPADSQQNLRSKMVKVMMAMGVEAELHHHEVATGGQAEIDIRFNTLTTMGDSLMKYKYAIKNVARRYGKTVTFMPKPLFQDNGSGMHVHQSLWKEGKNQFFARGTYAGLSDYARWYIGGLIHHAPSVLAFTNPTTNSYRRLVPGYEAPVNLIYSQRNRSACVRIPMYSTSEKAKRIEFRTPDPSCNGYLAFAAMLMAGLDGIQNKIEPPDPVDQDLYELPDNEKIGIGSVPSTLAEVLDALEKDHEYLLKGGVFTQDLIDVWIDYKRKKEVDFVRLRPHPAEFMLYYDI